MLPLFNKAICKYTKLIKASYEQSVVKMLETEEKKAPKIELKSVGNFKAELDQGKGTQLAQQMHDDKIDFVKMVEEAGFEGKAPKDGAVISLPRKRERVASEESETLGAKKDKKVQKSKKNKRAKM